MKTCATCRFMAAERIYEDSNASGFMTISVDGEAPYEERVSQHRTCARIIHGNVSNEPSVLTEPAVVVDGSGYAARLLVLPTFGCVLHEENQ